MKIQRPTPRAIYRLFLVGMLGLFLVWRLGDLVVGRAVTLDVAVFVVWASLLLSPLFAEMSLGGFRLKQIIEDTSAELKREIASTRSELASAIAVSNTVTQHVNFAVPSGSVAADAPSLNGPGSHDAKRSAMELKILNTLIHKQMLKWPDRSQWFTFRLATADPEFVEWRVATSKLLGEGLIAETDEGQVFLTNKGFNYCAGNYHSFPKDQWWPTETMGLSAMLKLLSPK